MCKQVDLKSPFCFVLEGHTIFKVLLNTVVCLCKVLLFIYLFIYGLFKMSLAETRWRQMTDLSVISGFRRDGDETCALLGYHAAFSGISVPTFRDNLSVPHSWTS
jgi:hypothetical protein